MNGAIVTYDKSVNMTRDYNGIRYEYDAKNQLIAAVTSTETIAYLYHPDGKLRTRTETANDGQSTQSQTFYYGVDDQVAGVADEQNTYKALLRDVSGHPAAMIDGTYYLEANGSTVALLDSNGTLKNTFDYTSYGLVKAATHHATESFLWNGEYEDPKTRLTYLNSRWVHPEYGRFMTRDTYEVDNLYGYADADPINKIDPTGHWPIANGTSSESTDHDLSYGQGITLICVGQCITVVSAVCGAIVSRAHCIKRTLVKVISGLVIGVVAGVMTEVFTHVGETRDWDDWTKAAIIGSVGEGVSNAAVAIYNVAHDHCAKKRRKAKETKQKTHGTANMQKDPSRKSQLPGGSDTIKFYWPSDAIALPA